MHGYWHVYSDEEKTVEFVWYTVDIVIKETERELEDH